MKPIARTHDGPIVVACGGGTNSAAVLVGCVEIGQHIDLITFSDTGGEKPETYTFVETLSEYCTAHGLPPITTLRAISPRRGFEGLYGMTWRNETLPSKAFGMKSCSQRYKIEPQEKFLNHWEPAKSCWSRGGKLLQVIGFDAGEERRAKSYENDRNLFWYPLIDWRWTREECVQAIQRAGLPLPGKSACFFCPSMRKAEVLDLAVQHPLLFRRAVELEDRALTSGKCTTIKGLGRHWSWRTLAEADDAARHQLPEVTCDTDCACFDGDEDE